MRVRITSLKTKKILRIIQLIFAIFATIYLITLLNMDELKIAFNNISFYWFSVATSLSLAHVGLSSFRWYLFIPENVKNKINYSEIVKITLMGHSLIFTLPWNVGHVLKPKLLPGRYSGNLLSLVMSQLMEINAFILVGLLFIGGLWPALAFVLVWCALLSFYDKLKVMVKWKMFKKINKEIIRSRLQLAIGGVIGLLTLLIQVFGLVACAKAFGVHLSMSLALIAVVFSSIFGVLFSTPGGIGGNEFGITLVVGSNTSAVLIAFIYKLVFQYIYSAMGSILMFARSLCGEKR